MRFHIDHHENGVVHGWVTPDDPTAIPQVRVLIDGLRDHVVRAEGIDPAFQAMGWHATGQCRFSVCPRVIPIAPESWIEIFEYDTNTLIFSNRADVGLSQKRVFFLETAIAGSDWLDLPLSVNFGYRYKNLHNLPDEIVTSVLSAAWFPSAFLSSRCLFARYEAQLSANGYLTAILVRDPFVEMAERILFLKALPARTQGERWRLGPFAQAAAYFANVDVADGSDLRSALRRIETQGHRLLTNPTARQLGMTDIDADFRPPHSINAIEVLSRFDVVGHASRSEAFVAALADRIGWAGSGVAMPKPRDRVLELAERLRRLKVAHAMLHFDLILSEMVEGVYRRDWQTA